MPACSLSMAATATAIPTSSSSAASSSSPSLSYLSFEHLFQTTSHFSFKAKPIRPPKLTTQFTKFSPLSLFSRSLCFSASAAGFDGAAEATLEEDTQNVQSTEAEQQVQELPQEEEEEEVEEDEGVESLAVEERRLYVGNLPYSMTSSQLSDLFAEAGRVISVELIYDRVTDRSRGFAFVTMGSVEEANGAIRMFDGSQVGGRTVKVNFPEVPKGGEREVMGPKIRSGYQGFIDSPHKIYAGNLSWSLTSQGLREAFANQPGLLSAKVIYERDSGRSRGYGFITFASAEEVESALNAMNGVEVEGRPMRLNLSEQRAPASTPVAETNSENEVENSEILSSSAPVSTPPVAESNSENGSENSEILSSASI